MLSPSSGPTPSRTIASSSTTAFAPAWREVRSASSAKSLAPPLPLTRSNDAVARSARAHDRYRLIAAAVACGPSCACTAKRISSTHALGIWLPYPIFALLVLSTLVPLGGASQLALLGPLAIALITILGSEYMSARLSSDEEANEHDA